MTNPAAEFFAKHKTDTEKMKMLAPDIPAAFGGMFQKLMKDGALTLREKELIALGMAIAIRCVPCINMHVKKCVDLGVTREQVLEVAAVAVVMQGGPGFTYVPVVIDALEACGQ